MVWLDVKHCKCSQARLETLFVSWNTFQPTTTIQPILKLDSTPSWELHYTTIWEFYVIGNNENKAKYKKKESMTEEKEEGGS